MSAESIAKALDDPPPNPSKTIASTNESNVARMTAALEPRHGQLTVVPGLSADRPKRPGRPGRPYRAEKPVRLGLPERFLRPPLSASTRRRRRRRKS